MKTQTIMKVVAAPHNPLWVQPYDSKTVYWNGYILWIRLYIPGSYERAK